jgi:hypothetical protein
MVSMTSEGSRDQSDHLASLVKAAAATADIRARLVAQQLQKIKIKTVATLRIARYT